MVVLVTSLFGSSDPCLCSFVNSVCILVAPTEGQLSDMPDIRNGTTARISQTLTAPIRACAAWVSFRCILMAPSKNSSHGIYTASSDDLGLPGVDLSIWVPRTPLNFTVALAPGLFFTVRLKRHGKLLVKGHAFASCIPAPIHPMDGSCNGAGNGMPCMSSCSKKTCYTSLDSGVVCLSRTWYAEMNKPISPSKHIIGTKVKVSCPLTIQTFSQFSPLFTMRVHPRARVVRQEGFH